MEEDEDNLSQPSSGSSPPSSPQSNGRITVTVASVAPTPPQPLPPQNSLTLALPIQTPRTIPGSSGGGGREDCWSEGATSVLIDAWGERYLELSRGNLKQKHWKEVADIVGGSEGYMKAPTDVQCKNRIDTVKKKYKIEKAKIASGNGPSKWPFFERLDRLIGNNTAKIPSVTPVVSTVAAAMYSSSGQKVPVGIPVGRPVHNYQLQSQQQQQAPPKVQYTPVDLPQFQNPQRITSGSTSTRPQRQQQFKRRPLPLVDSDSEPEEQLSPDSADSFPPETFDRRRKLPKMATANPQSGGGAARAGGGGMQRGKGNVGGAWGNSVRELTTAMLNLAEAYEQAENLKLQQLVEMEKQRMKFAKDLELQRMKLMMKTQFDISQLSRDCSGGSRRSAGDGSGPDGGDGNLNSNHRIHNSVSDNNGENVDHSD